MNIQSIFEKKIDREIRGVIKVDKGAGSNETEFLERESIEKQELEEYVVTRELQKHFAAFFSNYKRGIINNTDKMGVWISGFFGSGKSHFLKTLAAIVGNKTVAGKTAIEYFKDDNKICDPMVLADMELAAKTSTDVILFNVDSKSESSGKQSKDAIVNVFLRAFNEMQGFCGSDPFIADLERRLVDEGKYEEFIRVFESQSGLSWVEERNSPIFVQDELVTALTSARIMSEESARNVCEKATGEYSISIEDFAKMVKAYINKKGSNHHVVFFVDEIGQYIADDSKLMLNLQTVTEDLGSVCKGKVWVVVTSQQDIDSVTKTKGNDFSKIQGRFDTRLSLSSANADEVIKKRILAKNAVGTQSLQMLYDSKATVIKNLISFNDGIEKKLFSDRDNFAQVYPFIPYQFNLTGSVLTAIRTYSSSGKHMADGERSLLALFKESAMSVKDDELGTIIPFCKFYEPIREFIDHSHSIVIKRAYDNDFINPEHEDNCFNVNVLKVLFMIKYVKEIKSNIDNLTSLMVSDVNEDRLELKSKVESALRLLVKQTYVQKSGENYVFLTNEEQEINRAVESQAIDPTEKTMKISEFIFEGIYDVKKYKHSALNGRYSFGFNQEVDGKPYKSNQNYHMSLKIITPNSGEATDDMSLRLMSGTSQCVIVALPDDRAFLDEITMALQIEKFIRVDSTNGVSKYEQIKADKKLELRDHNENARIYLEEALKAANIYVNGDLFKSSAKEPVSRINEALGKLVSDVYHKLSYIDSAMNESDIYDIFQSGQISISGAASEPNKLALAEMKNYKDRISMSHTKVSLKTIATHFTEPPYGFIEADIQWLVAKLFKDGDIAFTLNNEAITIVNRSAQDIVRYITRKEFLEKLMIEKKDKPDPKKIKAAKEIAKSLFGHPVNFDDDDSIMSEFLRCARMLKTDIDYILARYTDKSSYPGKSRLNEGKALLNEILQIKFPTEFYNTVYAKQDDLLDFAEDYEPIKKFFSGEQLTIFDRAIKYLGIYNYSKTFFVDKDIEELADKISKIVKSSSPFSQIYQLPDLLEKFMNLNVAMLKKESEPVLQNISDVRTRVFEYLGEKQCKSKFSDKFVREFDALKEKAKSCNNIASLKNIPIEADALKVRCINEIDDEEAKFSSPVQPLSDDRGKPVIPPVRTKKRKTVSIRSLNTEASWEIESASDVDRYIDALKDKLIKQLQDDTIIRIEF